MTNTPLTQEEVRREGLEALFERLGAADALRFLQQFAPGSGDYTAERGQWLDVLSVDEVVRSIESRRKSA
jgi:hypothetical protein